MEAADIICQEFSIDSRVKREKDRNRETANDYHRLLQGCLEMSQAATMALIPDDGFEYARLCSQDLFFQLSCSPGHWRTCQLCHQAAGGRERGPWAVKGEGAKLGDASDTQVCVCVGLCMSV